MDECQNVIAFNELDLIDDATDCINMGQSESKKNAKRTGPETKGTAMSFGFKKKLYPNGKKNEAKEKEKKRLAAEEQRTGSRPQSSTVISNPDIIRNDYHQNSDDNGNQGSTDSLNERETGRTTPRLTPPRKESTGAPYRSIRFGFRQGNAVRPASVGLNPTVTTYDTVTNNNVTAIKPRSKSASNSSRSVTPIGTQLQTKRTASPAAAVALHHPSARRENPKINAVSTTVNISYQQLQQMQQQSHQNKITSEAQHRQLISASDGGDYANKPPTGRSHHQYTVINTGMHTNEIVRPIPQSAAAAPSVTALVSKFTLHTSSLPKPQYPVPINLAAITPQSPSPPPPSLSSSAHYAMDTKIAKQAANTNRRGFRGPRDISTDSGISSIGNNYYSTIDSHESPRRSAKNKPRNFEMVSNGRHKFDVRELDGDSLSDETSIVPLALPQLPSAFGSASQPAPLSGLVRTAYGDAAGSSLREEDLTVSLTFIRKASLTSLDVDSTEEEKVYRDNSTSEKASRGATTLLKEYSPSSKNSSPVSSRASWCNAGESMAIKDCSSMSVSSCDSVNNKEKAVVLAVDDDEDTVGVSSMALTSGKSFLSTPPESRDSPAMLADTTDSVLRNISFASADHSCDRALSIEIGNKFAQITASVDDLFLDDETSPTDSLVSSTDSDDLLCKKNKKKINDSINKNIQNIDEISPVIELCSPLSPGTPTHATNSLSLSDEGRDFLIDDEIADQPALCFADSHADFDHIAASTQHLHSLTDTPTLIETASSKSLKPPKLKHLNVGVASLIISNNPYAPQAKPRQSLLTRTESLDTLSPCESIASDDMMMDFDVTSSVDSIDRMCQSVHSSSASVLHSLDETQLWSELEAQGGEVLREWSTLLRGSRQSSRETMISQLPARATRLLNRSRMQHSGQLGSDSPRSLDSFSRKTPPHRPSPLLMGRDSINSSDDNIFMLDKSLRNTMIQDVLSFKKQLIRLRSILQETDTLNPFEISNGQFFGSGGFDSSTTNINNANAMYMENKELYNYSASPEDTKHELADLRRQVVYLQSQMDDKDRTIRIQQSLIDKLETEIDRANEGSETATIEQVDTINTATQTERIRPLSIGGQDGSTSPSECDDWEPKQLQIPLAPRTPSPAATTRMYSRTRTPNRLPAKSNKPTTNGSNKLPTVNSLPPPSSASPTSKLMRKSPVKSMPAAVVATRAAENGHPSPSSSPLPPLPSPLTKNPSPRRIPRLVKQSHVCVTSDSGSGGEQPPPKQNQENSLKNGSYAHNNHNSQDILKLEHELYRHQRDVTQQLQFNQSNHKLSNNGNAINHIMHHHHHQHSPPVAVKLKNNLNVLKSPKFLLSVNSEDDF